MNSKVQSSEGLTRGTMRRWWVELFEISELEDRMREACTILENVAVSLQLSGDEVIDGKDNQSG
ncbi:uncharacterized protein N7511_011325 [Penicillium nucicola]|uniref:uncharacterized protein n=1 Tax=Penicillium nucicola TaxID=1850975 RepID=UPI0025458D98|nr:uncharacterized protein N7511_011325 [Penicillium nucicola]KAJ5742593.1 hypothetical protein N7511_011325 [Penicillium nucicola]